jgi:uncharacterized protein YcaQ
MLELPRAEARKLAFSRLASRRRDSVAEAVKQTGYLQIDTISVIARAHHQVLWSLMPNYQEILLDQAERKPDKKIIEYWAHAASYLPVDDFRFCLPRMEKVRNQGFNWFPKDKKHCSLALEIIASEGEKRISDFEHPPKKSGEWWEWKPMKIALEHLYHSGELLISRREGFQKVYDLPERVLPGFVDIQTPGEDEFADYLIDMTDRNLGIFRARDVGRGWNPRPKTIGQRLEERAENGEFQTIRIKDKKDTYFTSIDLSLSKKDSNCYILSPFDPFTINRDWLEDIFGYSYRLECYVPEAKRIYGYFTQLIFHKSRFLGLCDLKAERKDGSLDLRGFFLNSKMKTKSFDHDFELTLESMRTFLALERTIRSFDHVREYPLTQPSP